MLTAQRLRELLHYDPETGVFTRVKNSRRTDLCGSEAGCMTPQGYLAIAVDGQRYKAHRLAWLYVYGQWPDGAVDHIDQVKHNNRIANLREATKAENMRNVGIRKSNTSGVTGVYFNKAAKKWQAYIFLDKICRYLGLYETVAEAAAVRRDAELKLHGQFAPLEVAA